MSNEEWQSKVKNVALQMRGHIRRFISPISVEVEPEWGMLVGSASYIFNGTNHFAITNKHVIDELGDRRGSHHFRENDSNESPSTKVALRKPFASLSSPPDVAICQIAGSDWKSMHGASVGIPKDRIALQHNPVEREILFFVGYSQEDSKSLYSTLVTGATPYTTQQLPEPNLDFPDFDFHLPYPREEVTCLDEKSDGAPIPPGFSGSLVWNTKYVETTRGGDQWTPDLAVVTGILRRWIEKDDVLVATRVEKMSIFPLCEAALGLSPLVETK